jgi:hypothetical protein
LSKLAPASSRRHVGSLAPGNFRCLKKVSLWRVRGANLATARRPVSSPPSPLAAAAVHRRKSKCRTSMVEGRMGRADHRALSEQARSCGFNPQRSL